MAEDRKLTALVFGGTGLTGKFLTELLIADDRYYKIILYVRREVPSYHGKVKQIIFDAERISEIKNEITGDHLFCCIGTTIKKAGSKEAFLNTDHHLIVNIAKAAVSNGIQVFSFISSIGANPASSNFYLNTKGITEDVLKNLGFNQLNILRPSMLLGLRNESRPLEEFGKTLFKIFSFLLIGRMKKYSPVHALTVAKAMITAANDMQGTHVIESDKIEELGNTQQQ
ncbi:MAG: NAD(P)H-binding protein [Lentimicrobiaceae bacterium]|nr:NAD(P)H-binding protein [Lentimicrobiaceae bacterium]